MFSRLLNNRPASTTGATMLYPVRTSLTWFAGDRGAFDESRTAPVDLLFFTPSSLNTVQVVKIAKSMMMLTAEKTGLQPLEWRVASLAR